MRMCFAIQTLVMTMVTMGVMEPLEGAAFQARVAGGPHPYDAWRVLCRGDGVSRHSTLRTARWL